MVHQTKQKTAKSKLPTWVPQHLQILGLEPFFNTNEPMLKEFISSVYIQLTDFNSCRVFHICCSNRLCHLLYHNILSFQKPAFDKYLIFWSLFPWGKYTYLVFIFTRFRLQNVVYFIFYLVIVWSLYGSHNFLNDFPITHSCKHTETCGKHALD